MARRRFIQINGELVEVSPDYQSGPRTNSDSVLWNDRSYQDMGDSRFSSRTEHREYMKAHGLTTTDDFRQQWRGDEKRRIEARQGLTRGGNRQAIRESIQKLNAGYKPRIGRED